MKKLLLISILISIVSIRAADKKSGTDGVVDRNSYLKEIQKLTNPICQANSDEASNKIYYQHRDQLIETHLNAVKQGIIDRDLQINHYFPEKIKNIGLKYTSLTYASRYGNKDLVNELLILDCDVTKHDGYGYNAIESAAFTANIDAIYVLLNHPDVKITENIIRAAQRGSYDRTRGNEQADPNKDYFNDEYCKQVKALIEPLLPCECVIL